MSVAVYLKLPGGCAADAVVARNHDEGRPQMSVAVYPKLPGGCAADAVAARNHDAGRPQMRQQRLHKNRQAAAQQTRTRNAAMMMRGGHR
jgi:hypothetical protein